MFPKSINHYYCIKTVSHGINSHVLTGKNPCINQAIHVLLMHGFCTLLIRVRILGHNKNDAINSNVHSNERNLLNELFEAFFQSFQVTK